MGARERLEELLEEKGVSQAELARRIGEDRGWVNQRLPGARKRLNINADDIPRLAKALGVPCWRFFEDSECPEVQRQGLLPPAPAVEPDYFAEYVQGLTRDLPLPEGERLILEGLVALRRRYQGQAQS